MNNRTLGVLLVLLILFAGGYWYSKNQRPDLDQTGGYVDLVKGKLSTDSVYGLSVYRGSDPDKGFTLVRRGTDWIMNSHYDAKANINRLRTLLTNLESLEGEPRSNDPSVLADYDLDDSNAVHLVLKDESGNDILHLLLGKSSTGGGFIRKEGSNQVLLGSRNFLSDFGIWGKDNRNPVATTWLDLDIYKPNRESVTSFAFQKGKNLIAMKKVFQTPAKGDTTAAKKPPPYEWEVTKPRHFTALKTRADGVLTTLSNMRARDIAPKPSSPDEYGLGKDADWAEVTVNDSTTTRLLFGKEGPKGQFYMKVQGNDDDYWLVSDYVRGNVFKPLKEFEPDKN